MKFAMFTDTFTPSVNGVVTSMYSLISGLEKQGVEVIVFAPGKKTEVVKTTWGKIYYFCGQKSFIYGDVYAVSLKELLSYCESWVEKEDPDLYIIEDPYLIGLMGRYLAWEHKKPSFGMYHAHYEEYVAHIFKGKFKNFWKYLFGKPLMILLRIFHNSFTYTIALSEDVQYYLKDKGIKNTVLIPNAIDCESLKKFKKFDLRKRYKLSKSKKILLCVGRVSFEKQLDLLLRAMTLLDENYHLMLVGKGPELNKLKKLAEEVGISDRITFTGYVPDDELGNYYASADLFVSPSSSETFALVFLEAMSFGLPAVGSNKMGTNSLVKDGHNGYKFISGSPSSLADAIKLCFSDKKKYLKMRKNAIEFTKNFDKNKIARKFIELYIRSQTKRKAS